MLAFLSAATILDNIYKCCLFPSRRLNPASFLRPDAGDPIPQRKLRRGRRGFGNEASRPLSRPSPSANLVGCWKGNPLEPPVRGFHDSQTETVFRRAVYDYCQHEPPEKRGCAKSRSDSV